MNWIDEIESGADKLGIGKKEFNYQLFTEEEVKSGTAKDIIEHIFEKKALVKNFQWIDEYDQFIKWAANANKWLVMRGVKGRGKSILMNMVIPILFYRIGKVFKAVDIRDVTITNEHFNNLLKRNALGIDELGREEKYIHMGQRKNFVEEIVTRFENENKLLVLATNMSSEQFFEFYGDSAYDRVFSKSNTLFLEFTKNSLR